MTITKRIADKMRAEILNIQCNWMNLPKVNGHEREETMWAKRSRNFAALIRNCINDPEFLQTLAVSPWIKYSEVWQASNKGGINLLEKPIHVLELSNRTLRALEGISNLTVGRLRELCLSKEIMNFRGLGVNGLMDISHALQKVGLEVKKAESL